MLGAAGKVWMESWNRMEIGKGWWKLRVYGVEGDRGSVHMEQELRLRPQGDAWL